MRWCLETVCCVYLGLGTLLVNNRQRVQKIKENKKESKKNKKNTVFEKADFLGKKAD